MRDKNLVAPCYKKNKYFRIFFLLALSFFFFFLAKKVVIDNMIPFFRPPDPPLLHYFGQDISRPGIVHLYLQASCTFSAWVGRYAFCLLLILTPGLFDQQWFSYLNFIEKNKSLLQFLQQQQKNENVPSFIPSLNRCIEKFN